MALALTNVLFALPAQAAMAAPAREAPALWDIPLDFILFGATHRSNGIRRKVHIGYLAAIVAASNAGGSGSVVGTRRLR